MADSKCQVFDDGTKLFVYEDGRRYFLLTNGNCVCGMHPLAGETGTAEPFNATNRICGRVTTPPQRKKKKSKRGNMSGVAGMLFHMNNVHAAEMKKETAVEEAAEEADEDNEEGEEETEESSEPIEEEKSQGGHKMDEKKTMEQITLDRELALLHEAADGCSYMDVDLADLLERRWRAYPATRTRDALSIWLANNVKGLPPDDVILFLDKVFPPSKNAQTPAAAPAAMPTVSPQSANPATGQTGAGQQPGPRSSPYRDEDRGYYYRERDRYDRERGYVDRSSGDHERIITLEREKMAKENEVTRLQMEISNKNGEISRLTIELQAAKSSLDSLQRTSAADQVASEKKQADLRVEITEKKNEIMVQSNEINRLKEALAERGSTGQSAVSDVKAKLEEMKSEYRKLESKLEGKMTEIADLREKIHTFEADEKARLAAEAVRKSVEKEIETLREKGKNRNLNDLVAELELTEEQKAKLSRFSAGTELLKDLFKTVRYLASDDGTGDSGDKKKKVPPVSKSRTLTPDEASDLTEVYGSILEDEPVEEPTKAPAEAPAEPKKPEVEKKVEKPVAPVDTPIPVPAQPITSKSSSTVVKDLLASKPSLPDIVDSPLGSPKEAPKEAPKETPASETKPVEPAPQ